MRRYTKIPKESKTEMAKLHKKLWTVFATYIKERDKWTCITCGKYAKGSSMHAGHYVPRSHNNLRYDPRNTNAQCVGCNMFAEGRYDVYALKLQEKYGENILKELAQAKQIIKKWTPQELQNQIEYYQQKLKEL